MSISKESLTQLTIAPYLFGIQIVTILIWMRAVKGLSKLYGTQVGGS